MKNENYALCQLKYKLKEMKDRRVKHVVWKLTKQEREYLENLGYTLVPYLYEIRTKTFKNLSEVKSSLIRKIHYSSKQGKKTIVLKLKRKDIKVLEEYSIRFRPVKFEIFLVS